MKKLIILNFIILLITSCNNEEFINNKAKSFLLDLDSTSNLKLENKDDSLKLFVNIGDEYSKYFEKKKLLRDCMLTKVFIENEIEIPEKLSVKIESISSDKVNVFYGKKGFNEIIFRDTVFTSYSMFILKNVSNQDIEYYNTMMPIIKETYKELNYEGNLIDLLLDFYFFHKKKWYRVNFFLFYINSSFSSDKLMFNRNLLESILDRFGYEKDEWNREKIYDLYLDYYNTDTIYSRKGELVYPQLTYKQNN